MNVYREARHGKEKMGAGVAACSWTGADSRARNLYGLLFRNGSYSITITEVCSKNESIISDNSGKYRDYIELYNGGEATDLEGFTLTDGKATSQPFGHLPLEAGEYRVIFLGDDLTGFGIGASGGDCIQLLDPAGNIVAQVNAAPLEADQVMLFGGGTYQVSDAPSPGFENTEAGLQAFREGRARQTPGLTISEVLISNASALADENGRFSDVIELYNPTGERIYLGNCFLSDSLENRFRYRLPERYLEPGAYLLLFCDGENTITEQEIHTNFGLTHGETLVLTDRTGSYVSITVEHIGENVSLSLQTDGSYAGGNVSLGFANDEEGAARFAASRINTQSSLVISEVLLSSAGIPYDGAFQDVVEIQNRTQEAVSTAGWYLSDGGDPYSYPLPEANLAPGECLVVICGEKTTHFSLSAGENLLLMGPDFLYAPAVACEEGDAAQSIVLLDSSDMAYGFGGITLGYANDEENQTRFWEAQKPEGLMISEVMSANLSYLPGAYKTTADWLELYNPTNETLTLSDYCITDNADLLSKYRLPEQTLEPGGYCVIFLSKDDENLLKGYGVVPIGLSSQGDRLYLTKDGTVLDTCLVPELATDCSYGRGAGSAEMSHLEHPTPGEANASAMALSGMPTVNMPQGVYDDVAYIDIEFFGLGDIYYTTDCTAPGQGATLYTGPIRITQTTIFRVVCREPGKLQSQILTLSYIVNENDALPVVSIVTEPGGLWNTSYGIYTLGPNASEEMPYYGANYWADRELAATVSLFETDGAGFTANCGLRIFGGWTRTMPKKSLACVFRDCYGDSSLSYPVFGEDSLDTYETIILRAQGQDANRARMRDVVVTSLVGEATDASVQKYKPVVVYLDGQYYGLHYVREKLNENYVAGHYNVSADQVEIGEQAGWTSPDFRELVEFVIANDMSIQENYDYVCSQIDLDSYLDFFITQMWTANTDNGNVKFFRYEGGKWTWFVFDADLAMLEYDINMVTRAFLGVQSYDNDPTCNVFAARMIVNDDFKEKFLIRLAWMMTNVWTEENVLNRIDEIAALIETDMVRDCQRWGKSYSEWQGCVEQLRTFARKRSGYVLQHIQDYFNLSDAEMRAYGFAV